MVDDATERTIVDDATERTTVDDAMGAYDAALRAYFVAARNACAGDGTDGAGDADGTDRDVVTAVETAADRLRARVVDDRRTWTVCGDEVTSRSTWDRTDWSRADGE